jgi:hypothetical protein
MLFILFQYKETNGGRWITHDEDESSDEESFQGDLPSITINK